MSFLNQLKTQAKALQTQRTEQDSVFEERASATEKATRFILPYIQDLGRQLNVLEPAAPPFTLDGKTPWPAMKFVDFRVDARRKLYRDQEVIDYIGMGWRVVPQVGSPVGGVVSVNFPPDQQRVESRLNMGPVKHERKEVRHPEKNVLQAMRYEYITETRGSMMATADHENAQIEFRLMNTAGFEIVKIKWPAARIGHESMDELAKRIVGQPNRFV